MTVLTGSTGNDSYTGASSAADTAVIGANSTTARFSFDGVRWTVISGAGMDTLSSVESVRFTDRTFGLVAGYGYGPVSSAAASSNAMARLPDGGWVVTWQGQDASGSGIWRQRFNAAGEKIGSETQVNTTTTDAQTDPSAAGLAGGGYVVGWKTQGWNTNFTVFRQSVVFQRYDAAGNKIGGEVSVDSVDTSIGSLTDFEFAGTGSGGFAVTWGEKTGTSTVLHAQLYDSAGAKVGANLSLATLSGGSGTTHAEVVALGDGYVAVWEQATATGTSVFHQRVSETGAKLGSAVKIGGSEAYNQHPVVASLEDGGYVVAWSASDGSGIAEDAVFVQRFASNGSKIGKPYAVDGDTQVYSSESMAAAGLEDGGFVVVWRGLLDSTAGTYLQRFDSTGAPVGSVQAVAENAYLATATNLDVVSLANGGFAVSWTDGNQVYAQRFNAEGRASMSEISGTAEDDVISFTGGTHVKLVGKSGNDSLTAGSGSDVIDGGAGTDTMTGGNGNDTYVWQTGDTIVETAGGGIDTVRTSVSYTLASRYLENAVLTGTAKGNLVGNGWANELSGNSADNVLNGGGGADTMTGGAGDDTYVVDHAGDRTLEVAAGGVDTVVSSVSTVLAANLEHLRLGGADDVDGTGNAEANLITGNAYDNRLEGLAGADTLIGGRGDDTYVLQASAQDEFREYDDEGSDTIEIDRTWVLDSAIDSIENLTLRDGGAFSATGDGIGNVIQGNSQANLIDGKAGADTMDGGDGDDTYIVDNADDIASEIGGGGTDLVKSTVSHTLDTGIDNLTLLTRANLQGTGNDLSNVITGNAGANALDGMYGADTLVGGGGNDRLSSDDGLDLMKGGTGNDTYLVSTENDEIVENASEGVDAVIATVDRSYTLSDNVEKLTLVGMHIDGHGNNLANTIIGTDGNNLLDGATGADTLRGMAGDDVYIVDNAGDVVVEAALDDRDEVFATVSYTLGANVEYLTLGGSAAIDGTGNTLDNRLIGNDAANTLNGGSGDDLLMGYGGADRLVGGAGADTLKGGTGNDIYEVDDVLDSIVETGTASAEIDLVRSSVSWTLGAGLENLTLSGSAAADGTGNLLRNTLTGNAAANILDGGAGSDTLTGGGGPTPSTSAAP
jgi:Ca2+-binding RTX toxin-like protein